MGIFDKAKDKKAAEEAKKVAEEAARKARIAGYEAKAAESKVKQATAAAESKVKQAAARAEKAEKELRDMKAGKVRQDIIAKQKGIQARAQSGTGMGMPGKGPLGVQMPKIIASYTVKKGDTLSQIAKQFYGVTGPQYWNLIQAANKDLIKDVNKIDIGQVFKIPELPLELKKK